MFINFDFTYIIYFFTAGLLALILTPLVRRFAFLANFVDSPIHPRKIHKSPMPLLGGLVVFIVFVVMVCLYLAVSEVNYFFIPLKFFLAILGGSAILMVGGMLDDKYDLSAPFKILFPAAAAFVIVASGIGVGIKEITNPFGAPIRLDFPLFGLPFAAFFSFFWMLGMTFTTKLLDGLDGLASGIGLIASLTLFFLSLTPKVNQPITATLAIILAGTLFGYLRYSFNPAKIFLGEGGSLLIGFILGALSILSGAKIATALLVMGIPILDVAWVIVRRLWYRTSPFSPDRKHLHFRLLDIGLSHKQSVLVLYGFSAVFGFTAVFLQSMGKLIALIILFLVMLILAVSLVIIYKKKESGAANQD